MPKQDNPNTKTLTRTDLLARPVKHRMVKKYKGEKPYRFKTIERPVVPIKNQRFNMLAELPQFKKTPKYEVEKKPSTYVKKAALEAQLTPRIDHLSRPFVRYVFLKTMILCILKILSILRTLQGTRREHGKALGKPFVDTMNEKIQMSWDTIYYFNEKSKKAVEAEK